MLVRRRSPADSRRARRHRSAAGGRFRRLAAGARGGIGQPGGSSSRGQRACACHRTLRRRYASGKELECFTRELKQGFGVHA